MLAQGVEPLSAARKWEKGLLLPVRIDRAIDPQPPPRSDPLLHRRQRFPFGGGGGGEVEAFQRHIAELLLDLAGDNVLSLSWMRKLLDVFLICLEEFRVLLFNSGAQATPSSLPLPLDRLLADFFDRAVKALDVCNAVCDGVDQIRQWQKLLDIVLVSLAAAVSPKAKQGPIRRVHKARHRGRHERFTRRTEEREREKDEPERAGSNRERRKREKERIW
uniref:Uncharacterized protein n=1 Tax=Ananas comosus var. bracteatus TaxID=296719 RepID=A0A6V7NI09_ANACO|nr:unnamed protein product [Ananas comosus var. bracteatus]